MKRTSGRTVTTHTHRGKVHNSPKFHEITGVRKKAVLPHGRDDATPINMLRRRLLSSDCEPVAGSGDGPRVAGDWEQWVGRPVLRLADSACVRFPRVYGEGRRLKGSAKKPSWGRTRVSLSTAWMHPSATRRGLRAVYVSETHP